jgi:ATP-dependent exoDNAse (exonuclease V) alpha subunit
MTYTITREVEDDFGRKSCLKEAREFAKGDRIVFTRNNDGLGVKNGSMGTITNLTKSKVQVQLDEGKDISFSPNLNPYFDQGWAVTIHKSQGTTVDRTFVLASYEMSQNLTYVAMTRHREDVHIYGSTFDFWRPEKFQKSCQNQEKSSQQQIILMQIPLPSSCKKRIICLQKYLTVFPMS